MESAAIPAISSGIPIALTSAERTVLRITSTRTETASTLKVEGRLTGQWVDELSRATAAAVAGGRRVVLDLADVTFVDAEGIALLRELRAGGFALADCSSFVSGLIDGARP